MKILVPIKRVPDTEQKFRVRADGLGIEVDHLPFMINPFDAIALEESLRLRETSTGEVMNIEIVAVSIGEPSCQEQLQTTLALGADRAIHVDCDRDLDSWNVSRILESIVRRESPELVLMGKQAVDSDCNQTGQFLAAALDWPQATFATHIELLQHSLRVERETDAGTETLDVPLPAVVTTDLRLNEPRYATLAGILAANEKTIEVISPKTLRIEPTPVVRTLAIRTAQSQRKQIRIDDCAALATCLRYASRGELAN